MYNDSPGGRKPLPFTMAEKMDNAIAATMVPPTLTVRQNRPISELRFALTETPKKGSLSIYSLYLYQVLNIPAIQIDRFGRTARAGGTGTTLERLKGSVHLKEPGTGSLLGVQSESVNFGAGESPGESGLASPNRVGTVLGGCGRRIVHGHAEDKPGGGIPVRPVIIFGTHTRNVSWTCRRINRARSARSTSISAGTRTAS